MSGQRGPSTADELVTLAEERYALGRADDGEPYAVERSGPNVARFFRGGRASLRAALAAAYADQHDRVPSAQSLVDALAVLEGRALQASRRALPLRSARTAGGVVLDMGDETGRAIAVTAHGWEILDRSPVTFRRSELVGGLPAPMSGGDLLAELQQLLNLEGDDLAIVLAQLIGVLLGLPVVIVLLRGPAGVAKTSAARILVLLLDPGPAPVRGAPKDPEAWAVTAAGSVVVALDNLDTIPGWLSDVLCRAVTGEGFLRRALYTDGAISVVAFRRAVILTAIDPGSLRGDLADRLAVVDLRPIAEEDRLDDAAVAARFGEAHPRLLGAVLDLVVKVLAVLPTISLDRRPRMADYARVLAAVDGTLGTNGLVSYLGQRGELQRDAAEGDRVGAAVLAFMGERDTWSGTAAELRDALTPEHPPRDWPTTPRGLSAALRRVAQPLLSAGIRVTFGGREGHRGRRVMRLEKVGDEPSASAASTAPDPTPPQSAPDTADDADDRAVPADGWERAGETTASRPPVPADGADGADDRSPDSSPPPVENEYPRSAWCPDDGGLPT